MIKRYARIQAERRDAERAARIAAHPADEPAADVPPASTYQVPDDVTEADYHPDADPFAVAISEAVNRRLDR